MQCSLSSPGLACDKKWSCSVWPRDLGRGLQCLSQNQMGKLRHGSGACEGSRCPLQANLPSHQGMIKDLRGLGPFQSDVCSHSAVHATFMERQLCAGQ